MSGDLLDTFAAAALTGLCAAERGTGYYSGHDARAHSAWQLARRMMEQREKVFATARKRDLAIEGALEALRAIVAFERLEPQQEVLGMREIARKAIALVEGSR